MTVATVNRSISRRSRTCQLGTPGKTSSHTTPLHDIANGMRAVLSLHCCSPPTGARPLPKAPRPLRVQHTPSRIPLARKRAVHRAMAAQLAQEPGYKEETLSFVNAQGERLVGLLLDTGSPEVVVLCHGYVANKNYCQFPRLAAGLAEAGYSSFRFDHAMAIFSESERKGPFLMGNHADEVADMQAAVQLLRGMGRTVACLLGHSKGGINVVLYGARHGDVPKMVDLSGRFCVRDGVLQRFGADIFERLAARPEGIPRTEPWGLQWVMTEEDFRNRADIDMEAAARSIPPSVEVLVLHGTGDATIPYQESERCVALIPNVRLQLIEGADHNFTRPEHARQMIEAVVAFVKGSA